MPTIDETIAAQRTLDTSLLQSEETYNHRSLDYMGQLLATVLELELASLPTTAQRWENNIEDGVVIGYTVIVTLQKTVYGQSIPLTVKLLGRMESTTTIASGVATTVRRLVIPSVSVITRKNPERVTVINGYVREADLVNFVVSASPTFHLRQILVTDPAVGQPWPEVDIDALRALVTISAAAALYEDRYPR
jgi:hypothetical protein